MIDPQTWLVAVAACGVIVAVWAWGILREDAAVVRAHASGIAVGRALERSAARGALAPPTATGDPAANIDAAPQEIDYVRPKRPTDVLGREATPSTRSAGGVAGQPRATARRDIPAWLRTPGGGEGSR